jgi:fructose-bisphosphate aldolase class I
MAPSDKQARMRDGRGFIAALDQSGGSTPGALRLYGVPDDSYRGDDEMFAQMHAMRVRIMTAPAFTGDKVLGAILFEKTMDGEAEGRPVPEFLWEGRGVVPFLKVDQGLAAEADGVSLMKPMPKLQDLLDRATARGIFGTKMRSVIHRASRAGIAAIVAQQFEIALQIAERGLTPIVEPEVSIKAPDKAECEAMLREDLLAALGALPADRNVMLKLTLPDARDFYAPLVDHPRVLRVVALSGGYSRAEACRRLTQHRGVIASFSRALVEDLKRSMSDDEFNAALGQAIDEIYRASAQKTG